MLVIIILISISLPTAWLGYAIGYRRKTYNVIDNLKREIFILKEQNAGARNILAKLPAHKYAQVKTIIDIL